MKIKMLLRWAGCFILCFLVIYIAVFLGVWKLFESGDPLLIEVGVALILSIFFFAMNETVTAMEKRIKTLEERIVLLEEKTMKS